MKKLLVVFLTLLPLVSAADERILRFHSDILVLSNGSIEVTETITVRAEGSRIRRGIYRDIPTEYFDTSGNRHEVSIEPLAVLRNNAREDFHTVNVDRGIRVYFGNSKRFLPNGTHTYSFRYRAGRMLGFFDEHDELYWNVTGFDWAFPIDEASAAVSFEFPVDTSDIRYEAYTGSFGAQGQDYDAALQNNAAVLFESTRPLSAVNGLTIVVGWPKGFVREPTGMQRVGWLLRDNVNLLIALGGFVLLLAYYIPVWRRYGKDPDEGVIVARYEPPDGFSPASLRYIRQMYYDDKVMTAAVVNLAVKGYLRIVGDDGEHSLVKSNPGLNPPALAAGEQELYEGLFEDGAFIELTDDNHVVLGAAKDTHRRSLKDDYKKHYFQTNALLNIPGMVIVIGTMLVAFYDGAGITRYLIAAIALMFLTLVFFSNIMRRPTLRGQKLLDEMLGFKDYLEIAEKDELNLRNPPEKTPQLFEQYLPFALALGVDQKWSEKFAAVLAAFRNPDGGDYHPAWYGGSWNSSNPGSFSKNLSGGLNSAIASSVTPPGSSSGGGGGGFSGGGGGGGGGGGW
jgi:uncharacterized membrane protein YgcG